MRSVGRVLKHDYIISPRRLSLVGGYAYSNRNRIETKYQIGFCLKANWSSRVDEIVHVLVTYWS